MGGKQAAQSGKGKDSLPEPPKFGEGDMPEPPNLKSFTEDSSKAPFVEHKEDELLPIGKGKNPIDESNLLYDLPEPPKEEKKGFFSKILGKFKKEKPAEKIELGLLKSPEEIGIPTDKEQPNLGATDSFGPEDKGINEDFSSFAPPNTLLEEEKDSEEESGKLESVSPSIEDETGSLSEGEKEQTGSASDDSSWYEEGEAFLDEKGEIPISQETQEEPLPLPETPVEKVKGVGAKRKKLLQKAGIKTAEHLASYDHKELAKKTKIPVHHAKKIVQNAKSISNIREKFKLARKNQEKGISQIIKQLEEEKKVISRMEKDKKINEEKLVEIEGHRNLISVLDKLEKKRRELVAQEQKLAEKEIKLAEHDKAYRRDLEHIEKLKRRLDNDIRERTQYLINLEKEYFQKAQELARKQTEVEVREKQLEEKEKFMKERQDDLRKKINELEDRALTIQTKEKKLTKLMQELEKQDSLLKEKEDDLLKREEEYLKKLDILETHERGVLTGLEERRRRLEVQERELSLREKQLEKKQRNVDKKSIAIEYAKKIMEEEKGKLIDDEFDQYLKDQLSGGGGISLHDLDFIKSLGVAGDDRKGGIYDMIDTCRDLLKAKRVSEAKIFYNKAREKYYSSDFSSPKEKENVHNMIRTLYDEINLADMGREDKL